MYVQSDTLLLADIFNNFPNMCLEMYGLDPACFLTAQGLEWHATLKKAKVKLYLITDFDILLIIKKASEAEYVMLSINMRKLIINS